MTYRKKVICSKESLKPIREFVKDILSNYGVSLGEANLITLAVDEVCSNIIIHSNCCNPSSSIELIVFTQSGSELIFEVHDKGKQFNITEYDVPDIEHIVRNKQPGGIGLILVKKIMDRFSVEQKGKKNVYRLCKFMSTMPLKTRTA